jgi:hypothetical protein
MRPNKNMQAMIKGAYLTGANHAVMIKSRSPAPPPQQKSSLAAISARMTAAQKKLEELAAQIGAAKRLKRN